MGPGPDNGVGAGPIDGTRDALARLRLTKRKTPAMMAAAAIASMAMPIGEIRKSRSELLGSRWSVNWTAESSVAFRRFIHVAELAVMLLGAGVPAGTLTLTA